MLRNVSIIYTIVLGVIVHQAILEFLLQIFKQQRCSIMETFPLLCTQHAQVFSSFFDRIIRSYYNILLLYSHDISIIQCEPFSTYIYTLYFVAAAVFLNYRCIIEWTASHAVCPESWRHHRTQILLFHISLFLCDEIYYFPNVQTIRPTANMPRSNDVYL